jgi:hypothetical protein
VANQLRIGIAGQVQRLQARSLESQASHHFGARHFRHRQIRHYQVEARDASAPFETLPTIGRVDHGKSDLPQKGDEQSTHTGIVIRDQHDVAHPHDVPDILRRSAPSFITVWIQAISLTPSATKQTNSAQHFTGVVRFVRSLSRL